MNNFKRVINVSGKSLLLLGAFAVAGQIYAGEKVDKSLETQGVTSVNIENEMGNITIIGWDKAKASIEGELDNKVEKLTFERNGSHLNIHVELPKSNHWGASETALTIHIPKNIHVNFDGISANVSLENLMESTEVRTISGTIKAKNLQKNVELRSVSGDVITNNLSGELSLATVSGNIQDEKSAGELQLQAVSGDISSQSEATEVRIDNVSGDTKVILGKVDELKVSTVSADADVTLFLNDKGRVKFSSVSADLDIKFQTNVQATFKLKASAGGDLINAITSDKAEEAKYGPSEKLQFQTGNGNGSVKVKTVSGKIKLSTY